VSIDEFIQGCMRLKGNAKSMDMATMLYENKRNTMKFNQHIDSMDKRFNDVQWALDQLLANMRHELQGRPAKALQLSDAACS